ncbi:hypothetical protein JOD96_002753 [Flavobacterium sp. 1355]|nr:hypothetical protein [Flavobacterium sp. 1355]
MSKTHLFFVFQKYNDATLQPSCSILYESYNLKKNQLKKLY